MVKKYLIPKGKLKITSDVEIEGFYVVVKLSDLETFQKSFIKTIDKFQHNINEIIDELIQKLGD